MNHALTLPRPTPIRIGPVIFIMIAFWLASAASLAPTLARTSHAAGHEQICHCAHCPGGANCCCRKAEGKCPMP
jgi:hypothetical protein